MKILQGKGPQMGEDAGDPGFYLFLLNNSAPPSCPHPIIDISP